MSAKWALCKKLLFKFLKVHKSYRKDVNEIYLNCATTNEHSKQKFLDEKIKSALGPEESQELLNHLNGLNAMLVESDF